MNTNKLKAYAPKARIAFMEAVMKRAAVLGIYEDKISEATTEGTDTIIDGRVFTRKQGQQRQQLVNRLKALGNGNVGYNQFINEMAFTWFNRFTAIRFMEVNEYLDHGFRVLSKKADAEFGEGFEILSHATDVAEELGLEKSKVVEMVLAGDKEDQLYKELLLGQCHQLSTIMPFMFEQLDDATELLLPDNLTKSDSILKELINDIPEDNWQEIEVIGWLYQFYILEHKDAVMGKVVKKEDIPAATQLFTPNWIVKYLVQNSLGHQWLSTYPDSELKDKMEYYITPAEQTDEVIAQLKAITPTSLNPEDLKIIDAAMGSGHILVEVYDLLREIYLEQGYRTKEIPELILTKNIYGLDIDDRACQLASFALLMKAREDDRRIFRRIEDNDIKLNLYSLQSTEHFNVNQLWTDLDLEDKTQAGQTDDLFAQNEFNASDISAELKPYYELLGYLKLQFLDAKNLGSLIEVDGKYLSVLTSLKAKLVEKESTNNPTTKVAIETVLPIVSQALVLATKYDCAVKNPPYMGSKGMNLVVKDFAKKNYPNSKSDLFAMFIERAFKWLKPNGFNAQVTMQSWMFLSGYEKMREELLLRSTIHSMAHLANGVMKIAFGTNATIFRNCDISNFKGSYSYCENKDITKEGIPYEFPVPNNRLSTATTDSFKGVPGSPIAYWVNFAPLYVNGPLKNTMLSGGRCKTHNDDKYVRYHWEVDENKLSTKWKLYEKGGEYRRWYGNRLYVVDWSKNARDFYASNGGLSQTQFWGKKGITWSAITSSSNSFRFKDVDSEYSSASPTIFMKSGNGKQLLNTLGYLNSRVFREILKVISPTVNANPGDILKLPSISTIDSNIIQNLIDFHREDWDLLEISDNYQPVKKFKLDNSSATAKNVFEEVKVTFESNIKNVQILEQELENQVRQSYGMEDESSDVSTFPISMYQVDISNNLKTQLAIDIISFSVGCMMGRYLPDRNEKLYAGSGNKGFSTVLPTSLDKQFPVDDDAIIPLASEEWLYPDDATTRFKDFVSVIWGKEHSSDNVTYIAECLCANAIKPKKNENSMDTIRRYFSTQFYKDHLKTYKKRPIYWLFSSGKEKAFECLVYLHRYNESTLARMRTEYVTPLMGKMEAQLKLQSELEQSASSTAEKKRLQKEIKSIEKRQAELRVFDEELKHLAEMKISIDLDDGVKVNYGKFGNLLHDVKGIHGKKPDPIK